MVKLISFFDDGRQSKVVLSNYKYLFKINLVIGIDIKSSMRYRYRDKYSTPILRILYYTKIIIY